MVCLCFKHAGSAMLILSLQSSLRLWRYVKKLSELKMDFRSRCVILPVYSSTSCNHTPSDRNTNLHISLFSSPEPVDLFFFSLFRVTVLQAWLVWAVLRVFIFIFVAKRLTPFLTWHTSQEHCKRTYFVGHNTSLTPNNHLSSWLTAHLCARLKLHCW